MHAQRHGGFSHPEAQVIQLPKPLRGYVRYFVVLHPTDSKPYSIGVKHVCNTEGAQALLAYLLRNVNRKHKKHVHSWLCQSSVDGSCCALGEDCPNIHVTPEGYISRRCWLRPLKGGRSDDPCEEIETLSVETDSDAPAGLLSPTASTSYAPSLESLSSICSSPEASRPISPLELVNDSIQCAPSPHVFLPRTNFRTKILPSDFPEDPLQAHTSETSSAEPSRSYFASHPYVMIHPLSQHNKDPFSSSPKHDPSRPSSCPLPWEQSAFAQRDQFSQPMQLSASVNLAPGETSKCTSKSTKDPRLCELAERQARLEKTRAKLHSAVDWILSKDDSRWANFATSALLGR